MQHLRLVAIFLFFLPSLLHAAPNGTCVPWTGVSPDCNLPGKPVFLSFFWPERKLNFFAGGGQLVLPSLFRRASQPIQFFTTSKPWPMELHLEPRFLNPAIPPRLKCSVLLHFDPVCNCRSTVRINYKIFYKPYKLTNKNTETVPYPAETCKSLCTKYGTHPPFSSFVVVTVLTNNPKKKKTKQKKTKKAEQCAIPLTISAGVPLTTCAQDLLKRNLSCWLISNLPPPI